MNYRIIIGLASILLILFFLWILGVFDRNNPLDSHPEKVGLEIEFIEINESVIGNSNSKKFASVKQKLPETIPYIIEYCYGINMQSDSSTLHGLKDFYNKAHVREVEKYIASQIGGLKKEKKNISTSFKRLKYHFPKKTIPQKSSVCQFQFCHECFMLQFGYSRWFREVLRRKQPAYSISKSK